MSLQEKIAGQLRTAMKEKDRVRLDVLRMVRARLQEAEVALRARKGREAALTDEEVQQVIAAYAKQRRDSIDSYRKGSREDLAAREEAELAILQEFLPRQLSEEELRAIIGEAIAEAGARSPRELGAVMQRVMPRVKGTADGKVVNRIAREMLAGVQ